MITNDLDSVQGTKLQVRIAGLHLHRTLSFATVEVRVSFQIFVQHALPNQSEYNDLVQSDTDTTIIITITVA